MRLPRAFYSRPTLDVLADLIGKVLVHERRGVRTAIVIVEAEAYIGEDDPACHAAAGRTPRNAPLYGPPGLAYVYFNYGMHYLVNAVTEEEGRPAAVLLRAGSPFEGVEAMRRRRMRARAARGAPARAIADAALCRGPGNLTVALGIDLHQNSVDLVEGPLGVEDHGVRPPALEWSSRIGIRRGLERKWRCHWPGHAAVSGPRTARSAAARRRPY